MHVPLETITRATEKIPVFNENERESLILIRCYQRK